MGDAGTIVGGSVVVKILTRNQGVKPVVLRLLASGPCYVILGPGSSFQLLLV
jgi:hypothetical protein